MRARVANDLTNLIVLGDFLPGNEGLESADFPCQFDLSRQEWERFAQLMVERVDYADFEQRIAMLPDQRSKSRFYEVVRAGVRELSAGWASVVSAPVEKGEVAAQFSLGAEPLEITGGRLALAAFTSREAQRHFISPDAQVTFVVSGGDATLDLALQVADTLGDNSLFALVLDPGGPYPAVLPIEALRQERGQKSVPPNDLEPTEKLRRPATIPFLEARGQLSAGATLRLVRLPKKGLLLPDSARLATYLGQGKARWHYDQEIYSLSALCQKIMQIFGGVVEPGPYAGPDYWGLSEGVSLSQMAKQS